MKTGFAYISFFMYLCSTIKRAYDKVCVYKATC